jgi:hypothetical protein
MQEVWKQIKDFEDYKISNLGTVISYKNNKPKILKLADSGRGYKSVWLCSQDKSKRYTIHRLVAAHFIENPQLLPEVNHIDGDKNNNSVNNLEWVSGYDNLKHARDVLGINKKGTNHHAAKLTEQDVINIINLYKTGNYTQKQIAEIYNVGSRNVQKITSRTRWKHLQID